MAIAGKFQHTCMNKSTKAARLTCLLQSECSDWKILTNHSYSSVLVSVSRRYSQCTERQQKRVQMRSLSKYQTMLTALHLKLNLKISQQLIMQNFTHILEMKKAI